MEENKEMYLLAVSTNAIYTSMLPEKEAYSEEAMQKDPQAVIAAILDEIESAATAPEVDPVDRASMIGTLAYEAKTVYETHEKDGVAESDRAFLLESVNGLQNVIEEARALNDQEFREIAKRTMREELAKQGIDPDKMPEYLKDSLEEMEELEQSVSQTIYDHNEIFAEIDQYNSCVNAMVIATNEGIAEMKEAGIAEEHIKEFVEHNRSVIDPARDIEAELNMTRAGLEQAKADWYKARNDYLHAVVDAAKDEASKAKASIVYFFNDAAHKAGNAYTSAVIGARQLLDSAKEAVGNVLQRFRQKREEFLDTITGGAHSYIMLQIIEKAGKEDGSSECMRAKAFMHLLDPTMYFVKDPGLEAHKEFYQNLHDENWFGKTSPYEDMVNAAEKAGDAVKSKAIEIKEEVLKPMAIQTIRDLKEEVHEAVRLPITIGEYASNAASSAIDKAKSIPETIHKFNTDMNAMRSTIGVELQTAAADIKLTSIQMQLHSVEKKIKKADREVTKANLLIEGLKQERAELHELMAEFGDRSRDYAEQRSQTYEMDEDKSEALAALQKKTDLNIFEKANLAYLQLYQRVGEAKVAVQNTATAVKNFGNEAYAASRMGEAQKRLGEIANELVAAQDNLSARKFVRSSLEGQKYVIMGKEAQAATLSPIQNMILEEAVKNGVKRQRALEEVYRLTPDDLVKNPKYEEMVSSGKAALKSICRDLGMNEAATQTLIREAGFTEKEPAKGFDVHTQAFKAAFASAQGLSSTEKAQVLLHAMDAAHETDNSISRMIPIEMLGYDKASESMKYISAMADRLGISVDKDTLKAAYGRSQETFAEKNAGRDTKDVLVSHLAARVDSMEDIDATAQRLAENVHPSYETTRNFVESKSMGM